MENELKLNTKQNVYDFSLAEIIDIETLDVEITEIGMMSIVNVRHHRITAGK